MKSIPRIYGRSSKQVSKPCKIQITFFVFYTLLIGFILVSGVSLFWQGYHNTDLSFNALNTGFEFDRINSYETIPIATLYIHGMNQMQSGFILIILATFLNFGWLYLLQKLVKRDEH